MRILRAGLVKGVELYLAAQFTKIRDILRVAGVRFASGCLQFAVLSFMV